MAVAAANTTAGRGGPLTGLRVIELGHFVAAPFCTRLLGDLGAEIIKVEPPTGDPVRQWGKRVEGAGAPWWSMHARNKRCIAVNLKNPEATALVLRLVAKCDALVENFRPGQLAKMGLTREKLDTARPGLIVAQVSGYGQDGVDRDRAAFGVIGEAIGGLRHLTNHPPGTSDLPPVRVGISIGNSIAGLYAAFGVCAALWARDRKGGDDRGRTLDVALTESILSMMEGLLPEYGVLKSVRQPTGSRIATAAPSNAYPTSDGKWILIAGNSDPIFARLAKLLGLPELACEPRFQGNAKRVENVAELDAMIAAWTKRTIRPRTSTACWQCRTSRRQLRIPPRRSPVTSSYACAAWCRMSKILCLARSCMQALFRMYQTIPAQSAGPDRPLARTQMRSLATIWVSARMKSRTPQRGCCVMTQARQVEIVEVGPRDGYQGIGPFIPTETKIALLERLMEAGLRRIEIGSFVSPKALPQMRDTNEILAACRQWPELKAQVLVPNEKWGREAVSAGAKRLVFVLSVSESHNRNNVRRTSTESAEEYGRLLRAIPPDVEIRLDLATSFDCPFEGRIGIERAMALLDRLIDLKPDAEICPCDTTGRADPAQVEDFFETALQRFPQIKAWALHAHDTYGLGLANVHAAYRKGVRIFDASFAGLGGCPFAPGATGNVATEDLVWMFERMGVPTGIDIAALLPVAQDGAKIPGGLSGGRVRDALSASSDAYASIRQT